MRSQSQSVGYVMSVPVPAPVSVSVSVSCECGGRQYAVTLRLKPPTDPRVGAHVVVHVLLDHRRRRPLEHVDAVAVGEAASLLFLLVFENANLDGHRRLNNFGFSRGVRGGSEIIIVLVRAFLGHGY